MTSATAPEGWRMGRRGRGGPAPTATEGTASVFGEERGLDGDVEKFPCTDRDGKAQTIRIGSMVKLGPSVKDHADQLGRVIDVRPSGRTLDVTVATESGSVRISPVDFAKL